MATKTSNDASSPTPRVALSEGDWLDVMDLDGVWSVARVLNVPSPDEVEITYDGWPHDYDEVVSIDSDRVAPYHTYTWAVKCWVKYLNWPIWPSIVTIRSPGTDAGAKNLAKENRLQVDFVDHKTFANRERCWQLKGHVKTFDEKHDERRTGTNGNQFELAYGCVLQSDATDVLSKFVPRGTLPAEFKDTPAESVEKKREAMGDDEWFAMFAHSQERHQQTHMYVLLGDIDEQKEITEEPSEESEESEEEEEVESERPKKVSPRAVKSSNPRRAKKLATAMEEEDDDNDEETDLLLENANLSTAAEQQQEISKAKRPKLSMVVKRTTIPERPKISTVVGDEKAKPKRKRTKVTTAAKGGNALPTTKRRLLCVSK